MKLMSGLLVLGLFLTAVFIQGCGTGSATNATTNAVVCNKPYMLVGTSCCLDVNNNGICDKDETPTTPTTPETPPVQTSEFTMKKGGVVNVAGKRVTLEDFSIYQGKLETIVDVDGEGWVIHETQKPEIVNGLRITAISVDRLQTYIMLKIVPEELDADEYLLRVGERQVILGQEFELAKIQDEDGGALLTVVDGDPEGVFIMLGMTKEYQGLEITNIEPFYRDIRAEGYGIFRIVPA